MSDDKAGVTCPQTPDPLVPGAFISCTASYTVTAADLSAGSVVNVAEASAFFNGNPVISNEDTVTVPAAELGSVGDTLYYDIDGNGTQDPGEPGVPGVTLTPPSDVDLGNGPGVAITEQTGPNGEYLFTGLPAGSYSVTVDTGSGSPVNGFLNSGDPDGGNDSTSVVTLTEGEDNLDQDFGYEGLDLGDTPDSYLTLLASGGPSHFPVGPTLGTVRDLDADGDDTNGQPNDEDGVSGGLSFTEGDDAVVTIGYVKPGNAPATVCGWMDLDDNGSSTRPSWSRRPPRQPPARSRSTSGQSRGKAGAIPMRASGSAPARRRTAVRAASRPTARSRTIWSRSGLRLRVRSVTPSTMISTATVCRIRASRVCRA